jgi:sugar O-acyltransferase (sialic acid O-acetyltransferase NeuD family)
MAKVVVFGIGQWASLVHLYLTHDSPHDVVAFTVDRNYLKVNELFGLPVVAFDEVQKLYLPDEFKMFVPLSFKKMNHLRAEKYSQAKDKGYEMISYVSSKATVFPGFVCGDNCFILEDNTIQPFVEIGNNVVMWSGNHIGHHSLIKDHVFISSHVVLCGCCTIEPFCFFGVNSTVRDETVVARETLVGAGALIMRDTKEFEVYIGKATEPAGIRSDQIGSITHKSGG